MNKKTTLLTSYQLTDQLHLKNRIVMAPMTRAQASDDGTPTAAMAHYYAARADAGLIITEGTIIHPEGTGYYNVPGIFTAKHIEHYKMISEAVHQRDGRIFMQLWHVGRVSHPLFLSGKLPLSASATTMQERIRRMDGVYYGKSRAATLTEIRELVQCYATAASHAISAGFDGVEIHGANGYLIDQFLHYQTNSRQDIYGGTAENMSRFAYEIMKACGDAIGYQRVGIRLSPAGYLNELVTDQRDREVFTYLLTQLNILPIAYVHTGNFDDSVKFSELDDQSMTEFIRNHYQGNLIASGGYGYKAAEEGIAQEEFDLVSMGRPFIANPDLITKFKSNQPIVNYDVSMLDKLA